MKENNLLIAFGGASPEHEVSVLSALQAAAALKESGYNLHPLYISKTGRWFTGDVLLELERFQDLKKLEQMAIPCFFAQNGLGQTVLREDKSGLFSKPSDTVIDNVLTAFHGSAGENGSFQGLCETFNIPYTGSGVLGSALGMDKVTAKNFSKAHGIPVVEGIDFYESEWIEREESIHKQIDQLQYPAVIKPVHLGSSIGVEVVKTREELIRAVETAFRYDSHILVEKAISPLTEINCSVLGTPQKNRASVCERPIGGEELLSFRDKYLREDGSKGMASADRIIPADISDELSSSIRETAMKIFRVFNCSGVARLDFLIDSDSKQFYFNEINTIPGSFSFYLWKETGVSFPGLLKELLDIAVEQHRNKNGRILSYETNLLSQKAVKGIKGLKGSK
jgi:D-alanine-D-alanine ligase